MADFRLLNARLTCNDEPADGPGEVHGHAEDNLPLARGQLHDPDEGGGVAGDRHRARDPPGEHKDREPRQQVASFLF